jgi:hypothetical protein
MIVHVHSDGSKGYQYEVGDPVVINDCIAWGAWLRRCVGKTGQVSRIYADGGSWRTSKMDVRYSPEWGPTECFPWQVEPTEKTPVSATVEAA